MSKTKKISIRARMRFLLSHDQFAYGWRLAQIGALFFMPGFLTGRTSAMIINGTVSDPSLSKTLITVGMAAICYLIVVLAESRIHARGDDFARALDARVLRLASMVSGALGAALFLPLSVAAVPHAGAIAIAVSTAVWGGIRGLYGVYVFATDYLDDCVTEDDVALQAGAGLS